MKRPDFIIAGATRSGLEPLQRILDKHPQIHIPTRKEELFFSNGQLSKVRIASCRDDFTNAVEGVVGNKIPEHRILRGESEFEPAHAREGCPEAKVIFTLRDPVERAYLQYLYAREEKKEKARNFSAALEAELSGVRTPDTTGKCWIYKNQYQTHIEHWLSFFARKNIFIMIYEEWTDVTTCANAFKKLEEFLGISHSNHLVKHTNELMHQGVIDPLPAKYIPLNNTLYEQLNGILSVDKTYIANFLERDIPIWKVRR